MFLYPHLKTSKGCFKLLFARVFYFFCSNEIHWSRIMQGFLQVEVLEYKLKHRLVPPQ